MTFTYHSQETHNPECKSSPNGNKSSSGSQASLPDADAMYKSKRSFTKVTVGHGRNRPTESTIMMNVRADAIEIARRQQCAGTELKRPRQAMSPRAFCEAVGAMKKKSTNSFFDENKDHCHWTEAQRREVREKAVLVKAAEQNMAHRLYRTVAFCLDAEDLRPGLRKLKEECEQAFDLKANYWPKEQTD